MRHRWAKLLPSAPRGAEDELVVIALSIVLGVAAGILFGVFLGLR